MANTLEEEAVEEDHRSIPFKEDRIELPAAIP
jgi:hypothetical protein